MRGTTAGRRLIFLALPFTAFGLLWALAPPVADALGSQASTARNLGWLLTGLGASSIAFGAYLLHRGDERIV
ncbi:hypothetical protein BRD56_10720 [Thermoplasmatales archaeon SW_10_69_26]|nr:MAG: hypothetical protein BRD56_10720 [Thermoplasmatales archaeon SW_10_69_26]